MITMGIGVVAGVFYWLASYKLAFWILVYAIIYGGLGILRGDNHARPVFRGDSEFTVAVMLPVACDWLVMDVTLLVRSPALAE